MKRNALLRHLRKHGCALKREGAKHSLWINQANGEVATIPRHGEIPDRLAQRICDQLGVIIAFRVGLRTQHDANEFMLDLAGRVTSRAQLTSDGLSVYLDAVENAFGFDVDFAQLQKVSFVSASMAVQVQTSPASAGADFALATFFCLQ